MKIIPKYQGGGIGIPLLSYMPSSGGEPSPYAALSASGATTKDKEPKFLDDNIMKQLYQKGLTSDVMAFMDGARSAIMNLTDLFGRPNYNSYKMLITSLTRITNEKERFDEAIKEVKKNGGMTSPVVNDDGFILVASKTSKTGMLWKDPSKLQRTDRVITNGMLARYRANDPRAAFDSEFTNLISNGIGIGALLEVINKAMLNLGSTSSAGEGNVTGELLKLMQGMQFLQNANPEELAQIIGKGDYRVTMENKTNIDLGLAALNYIMSTLPNNLRSVLLWLAVQQGTTPEHIVLSEMNSRLTRSRTFKVTDDNSNSNSNSNNPTNQPMSAVQMWYSGLGNKQDILILNGTSDGIHVRGNSAPITSKGGETLGVTTLDKVTSSIYGGVLDWSSAYMGDLKINILSLNHILVDANKLYMMELPIDEEAAQRGIIKPNYSFLPLIEKAEEKIREQGIDVNTEEGKKAANLIYSEFKIPVKYNAEGKEITALYRRFGVLNATASSKAFDNNSYLLSNWLTEVENANEIESTINALYKSKEERSAFNREGLFNIHGGTGYDLIVEGTVFLPVIENYVNTIMSSGLTPSISLMNDFYEPLDQHRQRLLRGIVDGGKP